MWLILFQIPESLNCVHKWEELNSTIAVLQNITGNQNLASYPDFHRRISSCVSVRISSGCKDSARVTYTVQGGYISGHTAGAIGTTQEVYPWPRILLSLIQGILSGHGQQMAAQTPDTMPNIQVERKEKEGTASKRWHRVSLTTLMPQEYCWLHRTLLNQIPFPAFGIETDKDKRRLGIVFKSPTLQYHIKKFTFMSESMQKY